MLVLLVVTLMVGVSSAALVLALRHAEAASFHREQAAQRALPTLAQAVQQHHAQHLVYPETLTALANSVGFEYVRQPPSLRLGYAAVTRLTDGLWQFDRTALYAQDARTALPASDYLSAAHNSCDDSAGFDTATAWCGRSGSHWLRLESRVDHPRELSAVRARLNRTLQKFADSYSATLQMPGGLTPGGSATLRALVGYPALQTAADCRGVWMLPAASPAAAVPLDCTDLFTRAGAAVVLNLHAADHVRLVADSGVRTAANEPVLVAAELSL